jgi:hypothetical protein
MEQHLRSRPGLNRFRFCPLSLRRIAKSDFSGRAGRLIVAVTRSPLFYAIFHESRLPMTSNPPITDSRLLPLAQVRLRMPPSWQTPLVADALLTLLFFRLASCHWTEEDMRFQVAGEPSETLLQAMLDSGQFLMNANAMFANCRAGNPAHSGAAIQDAMQTWINSQANDTAQKRLQAILRPDRFGNLFTDASELAKALDLIETIIIDPATPSPELGRLFAQAMHLLGCGPAPAVQDAMLRMAQLVQPQDNEIVFDPACGQGNLLQSCAAALAQRAPASTLHLCGMQALPDDWALACMLLHLSGQHHFSLTLGGPIHTPVAAQIFKQVTPADLVVTMLVQKTPMAQAVDTLRYALACMKPDTGRMGVLMPLSLLQSIEGKTIIRMLLELDFLDAAVGALTDDAHSLLILLLRQRRTRAPVAFINAAPDGNAADNVAAALEAWQQGQSHSALHEIDPQAIAKRQYTLDASNFGQSGTGRGGG